MSPVLRIVEAALRIEAEEGLGPVAAYHRAIELHAGHSEATRALARKLLRARRAREMARVSDASENMRRQIERCRE